MCIKLLSSEQSFIDSILASTISVEENDDNMNATGKRWTINK